MSTLEECAIELARAVIVEANDISSIGHICMRVAELAEQIKATERALSHAKAGRARERLELKRAILVAEKYARDMDYTAPELMAQKIDEFKATLAEIKAAMTAKETEENDDGDDYDPNYDPNNVPF